MKPLQLFYGVSIAAFVFALVSHEEASAILGIPLYRVSNRGYRITNQAAFHTLHPNHVTGLEGYRHIVFTRGCYPSAKNSKRNNG